MRLVFFCAAGWACGELVVVAAQRHGVDPVLANLLLMPVVFVGMLRLRKWWGGRGERSG